MKIFPDLLGTKNKDNSWWRLFYILSTLHRVGTRLFRQTLFRVGYGATRKIIGQGIARSIGRAAAKDLKVDGCVQTHVLLSCAMQAMSQSISTTGSAMVSSDLAMFVTKRYETRCPSPAELTPVTYFAYDQCPVLYRRFPSRTRH